MQHQQHHHHCLTIANLGSDIDTILAKVDNVFLCQWKVFLIKFRCYQFHNLRNSPRWCKIASSGNFPQKLPGGSFDRLQGVGDGLFIHSGLVTWGPPLLTLQVTLTCRRHLQSQHFQHHFHFFSVNTSISISRSRMWSLGCIIFGLYS